MNLYLHGLGNDAPGAPSPMRRADALLADPGDRWEVILTNPPFGRKQSIRVYTGDEAEAERDDYERQEFPEATGNKQLNFLQHCMTVLDEDGTAAVVLSDNVLSRLGRASASVGGCCRSSTATRCCVCRPAFSTARA